MTPDLLQHAWPYLLLLFALLCHCVLRVLGHHFQQNTVVHDLIRESRLRRNEYLRGLHERGEDDLEA